MSKKERVYIRIERKDKEKLFSNAEKAGVSASVYLRELINGNIPKTNKDFMQIKELIGEINRIGVNINQIVMHANSGFYSEHEKRKLFALMNKLVTNTENIIAGTGGGSNGNNKTDAHEISKDRKKR